jgi:hypothetical protein
MGLAAYTIVGSGGECATVAFVIILEGPDATRGQGEYRGTLLTVGPMTTTPPPRFAVLRQPRELHRRSSVFPAGYR